MERSVGGGAIGDGAPDSQRLLTALRAAPANATTVGELLPRLAALLARHRLLQPADVRLAAAWVEDLQPGPLLSKTHSPPMRL